MTNADWQLKLKLIDEAAHALALVTAKEALDAAITPLEEVLKAATEQKKVQLDKLPLPRKGADIMLSVRMMNCE